jgi:hypothetical protein
MIKKSLFRVDAEEWSAVYFEGLTRRSSEGKSQKYRVTLSQPKASPGNFRIYHKVPSVTMKYKE